MILRSSDVQGLAQAQAWWWCWFMEDFIENTYIGAPKANWGGYQAVKIDFSHVSIFKNLVISG